MLLIAIVLVLLNIGNGYEWVKWENAGDIAPSKREDGLIVNDNVGGVFYAFGGKSETGRALDDTWQLTLSENSQEYTWVEIPTTSSIPARFSMLGGIVRLGNVPYLVITTGDNGGLRYGDVWYLRVGESPGSSWTKLNPNGVTLEPRYGSLGGVVPGSTTLMVSHGFDKKRFSNAVSMDLSGLLEDDVEWKEIFKGTSEYNPSAPHARCLGAGTITRDFEIILFGGCLTGGNSGGPCPSNDGWVFERNTSEWSRVENKPPASQFARMTEMPLEKGVLLYGGRQTSKQVISTSELADDAIYVLDTSTEEWTSYKTKGVIPQRRENPYLVDFVSSSTAQSVLLFGGQNTRDGAFDTNVYVLTSQGVNGNEKTNLSHPWFTIWMLHGMFMFIAWGLCLQSGAFIARYFRHKDPFWFKFHRAVQSTGLLLAVVGFILGFLSASTTAARHFTFAHSIIGLIIMIIGLLQPLNAFIRPHPGEPYRQIWSLFHKNLGRLALALALINITLGLYMALSSLVVYVLWYIFLSSFIVLYIVFEYTLQTRKRSKQADSPSNQVEFVRAESIHKDT